jgi:hypothetical protein
MAGHEISGLNPVARSESLAAISSRTDLIQKKSGQMPIAKLKYLVANGDLATRNFAPCYMAYLILECVQFPSFHSEH